MKFNIGTLLYTYYILLYVHILLAHQFEARGHIFSFYLFTHNQTTDFWLKTHNKQRTNKKENQIDFSFVQQTQYIA